MDGAPTGNDYKLAHMFFLMHSWFVTSEQLVKTLHSFYERAKREYCCECVLPCKHKSKKNKNENEKRLLQLGFAIRLVALHPRPRESTGINASIELKNNKKNKLFSSMYIQQLVDRTSFQT